MRPKSEIRSQPFTETRRMNAFMRLAAPFPAEVWHTSLFLCKREEE